MKKTFILPLVIVILVVIALGIWIGIMISGSSYSASSSSANPDAASPYSAVYLTTGDIYFGKLSWFPAPHLTDVWYVERSQNQSGTTQLGVESFGSVFWDPVDELNFDAKQIVFWTRLKNSSQLVQAMENPASAGSASGTASVSSGTGQ